MAHQRLQHDAAFAAARALLEIVAPCLREEERRDAFDEFYRVCKAALEDYELRVERELARLCKPSRN